jgi:predicted nucleic acid-binding protein
VSWLIDSSALLRFFVEDDPENGSVTSCVKSLREAGSKVCFTPQVIRESWSVLTRPSEVGGFGLSTIDADKFVDKANVTFMFLHDTRVVYQQWLELVRLYSVSGRQVHDAYHVAAMKAHGLLGVVTLDRRDFKRYAGIEVLDPRLP